VDWLDNDHVGNNNEAIKHESVCSPKEFLLEFRSSKGKAEWPEEELDDLLCDVTGATATVISRV
jgi:hypothetical protein